MLLVSGDSYSLGPDHPDHVNALDKQWPALVAEEMAIRQVVSRSYPGHQAADQACHVQFEPHNPGDIAAILIGANDARLYKDDPAKLEYFKAFVMRMIGDYCIPTRARGRSSAISRVGDWQGTPVNPHGIMTTSAGASARTKVFGSAIYIGYIIQDYPTSASSADVVIDGIHVGSLSCDGNRGSKTGAGQAFAPALARFATSPGSHEVEVRVTTDGNVFYLDDIRSNEGPYGPDLYVGTLPPWSAAGYESFGATPAILDSYNRAISDIVSTMSADGIPVRLVDLHSSFQPAIHMSSDGFHPNLAGHQEIKSAFLTALRTARRKIEYHTLWGTKLSLWLENGVVQTMEETPLGGNPNDVGSLRVG